MAYKSSLARFIFVVVVAAGMADASPAIAAAKGAPAGQICPPGTYVIGFDAESNILCSGGEGIVPGADENSEGPQAEGGDGCTSDCPSGSVATTGMDQKVAVDSRPADPVSTSSTAAPSTAAPQLSAPAIAGVKPSSVVFGTREVEIAVSGTGFSAESMILFKGGKYSPSVNPAGTLLVVSIPTRKLSIGSYALTVSNGPGLETTLKKALEIY